MQTLSAVPSLLRALRGSDDAVTAREEQIGAYRTRVLDNATALDGQALEGPLIVLLHGFGDNADTWRPVLAELALRGRRAVAPDLPGFGSASPLERRPMLPQYDEFLAGLVGALGGGPAVVVGNSMGGTVALRAAQDRPGVVAVAALAPAGLGFHRVLHVADRALGALKPVLRIAYRIPYPEPAVQLAIAAYYLARIAPGGIVPAWRFGAGIHGMKDIRRMGALGLVLMREVEAGAFDLADMTAKVVLLWGSDDAVCDVEGAQELLDRVPGSELVMLDGAGHVPQVQRPDAVADVLVALVPATEREN